jgi:predicted ATPase/DNA-binding SARP family transcriptional activator
VRVLDADGRIVEVRGEKPKGLLALLGLRVGEVVTFGRIVDELWREQEVRDPVNAMQVVVSKLRKSLGSVPGPQGGSLIATSGAGYRLDVDRDVVDAVRFERLVGDGRRLLKEGAFKSASATLRQALDLWRGAALEDFDEEFARGDRARLEELRAAALELRIDADLELGRHEQVAAELASVTVHHPLRERLRGQQMLALYRSGRQADALRAYQAARTVLGDELGLEPSPELQRLEAAIATRDPAIDFKGETPSGEPADAGRPEGNLRVPLSSFIGRVDELDTVSTLMGAHRFVTLIGPGGMGKTRIALEAATRGEAQADGTYLIELAPLRDARDVMAATVSALGIDDAARLESFLAEKDVLLLVDNCEHVIDEAARVIERLLRAGPRVRVLATSRERLGVAGEFVWVVPPLGADDASALFRARAEASGVDILENQDATVDQICDRLDGLPLAVELAAARTLSLSLDDIIDRIDDRFRLLATGGRNVEPRQQTLRSVVDWSYDLLFEHDQRVFRRLSVFAGGFDLRAAERVCAGDGVVGGDVVDILGHLVDKSLVSVVSRDDGTRYGLLQTLVDYGRERLISAGEHDSTRDRHLQWMVEWAADAECGLRGPDQARWIRRLAAEHENVRAALAWARQCERAGDGVALVAGLAYGWYITGTVQEGQAFIVRALEQDGSSVAEHRAVAGGWGAWLIQIGSGATADAIEQAERAVVTARGVTTKGFCIAAVVASLLRAYRGLTVEATSLIEEAVAALRDAPDQWSQAFVDWVQSGLVLKLGDTVRATELLRASVTAFADVGDRYGEAIASIRLGELAELRGDYDEAIALTTFAYEGTMSTGLGANSSILPTRLGNLAALQGRFADAATWHSIALSRAHELIFPGPAAQALSGMAVAAHLQGNREHAESLHRDALAAYERVGSVEGAAFSFACLGLLAIDSGDTPTAAALCRRSLIKAHIGSERRAIALAVELLAASQALAGDGESAALMLGASAVLRGVGIVSPPWLHSAREQAEATARGIIGDSNYDVAEQSGRQKADTLVADLVAEGEATPY